MADEDKLDGYVAVAQSAKGEGVVMVIQQVLKDKSVFVFGELLDTSSVKALEKTPQQPWLDLLRLFAYGTFVDYQQQQARLKLPPLQPAWEKKLKQLTIVSLAAQHKSLPYSLLQANLSVQNVRELEDLVIETVYQGLIKGKLDQNKGVFETQYAIGRDIGPNDVAGMMAKLTSWMEASNDVLNQLEKQAAAANEEHERIKEEEKELEEQKKAVEKELLEQKKSGEQQLAGQGQGVFAGVMGMIGGGPRGGGGSATSSARRKDRKVVAGVRR